MASYLWLFLATLSVFICISDLKIRHISNFNCVCIFVLCLLIFINNYDYLSIINSSLVLICGFMLNRFNMMGGGDAKLLFAFSIAISPSYLLLTIMVIVFIGGLQAAILILFSWYKKEPYTRGVPYGFAICVGALFGIAASI
ncbi:prepilin peptidase [Moritella sp. 36]|uniref:A24 family peptidase n=1 Tax=Moritella sp. 36 TaxID=2746233 RepID=UPI001BA9A063|nr:prepilin peptidase [Moritella sp. 36]QUM90468.1 prepilin peptidase [Moritella sp. 36]